jgi:hypothetical protein
MIPESLAHWTRQAALASTDQPYYFFTAEQAATCAAACARLVPTGTDPATDPGANEAQAVVFIDRFLAAFELPSSVADNPAIWLHGRYSGRNRYPDFQTGTPSSSSPADDMLNPAGQAHFLPLTRIQVLSWQAQLYGSNQLVSIVGDDPQLKGWAAQVQSGLIPGVLPDGQRQLFVDGLAALDSFSEGLFLVPFAEAAPLEQDVMLALAGNIALDTLGLPLPGIPVVPPQAAEALFPTLLSFTFEGCYGLPEYRWLHSNPLWPMIGYDGDSQPLGNSIYDVNSPGAGPGEGPNAGFGEPGVYVPAGDYQEYRPVSYLGPQPPLQLDDAEAEQVLALIKAQLAAK